MNIKDLIKLLEEKQADHGEDEIEFLVATSKGQIIAALVQNQVQPMQKMLKVFRAAS